MPEGAPLVGAFVEPPGGAIGVEVGGGGGGSGGGGGCGGGDGGRLFEVGGLDGVAGRLPTGGLSFGLSGGLYGFLFPFPASGASLTAAFPPSVGWLRSLGF